jgi:hypothetical protein
VPAGAGDPGGRGVDTTVIVTVAVTTVVVLLVGFVVLAALAGGVGGLSLASRFLKRMRDPEFANRVTPMLDAGISGPPKPSGAPLRLLAVLQRDARLIDFLTENVAGYTDEQVGEFAKRLHADCKKVLDRHVVLETVLPQAEGEPAEVPVGFDPSAVRLLGNVTGQPPFKGTVKHPGWRVKELKLEVPAAGVDEFVLQPAEVDLP